ncbi:hypothetical protein BRC93_08820 [Halobacteriales archaeon QS_5_70_15]|nr:MAG: hypothetical protein BRC93_08820 [Halobacteriales archaeon QS_5_70_15]
MTISEETIGELIDTFDLEIQLSEEPQETLFDIIGRPARESYWQRLLAYFLDPARGHGFGTEILSTFLTTIEKNTTISNFDGPLNTIHFDVEVQTSSKNRVDLFLSQEGSWFLCIELKIGTSEHGHQTVDYVDATHVGGRAKDSYPTDGHHYLYLSADESNRPSADEFVSLTWTPIGEAWRSVLDDHRIQKGSYPTRGVAQFAEFLEMIRLEIGEPKEGMRSYYRDYDTAKKAYEDLLLPYTVALERGVREMSSNPGELRIRRKPSSAFPEFEHETTNRIEIDKPLWQAGRHKPAIVTEINFHIRPHRGPNTTKHRPSVAVYLDIRGGEPLKQSLRSKFDEKVDVERYQSHGFGEPYEFTKWHFLHKEVLIDDTDTPIQDVLDALGVLWSFESELDTIARSASS